MESQGLSPAARTEQRFDELRLFVDHHMADNQRAASAAMASGSLMGRYSSHQPPAGMDAEPQSPAGQPSPVSTPNLAFNKLATVLTYLATELRGLQQEASTRWYPMLAMFGEGISPCGSHRVEGDMQLLLANALPHLKELLEFTERLQAVLVNLTAQLGSLSAAQMRKATIVQGDTAQSMWHALAEGLGVLLRLEVLAEQNSHIPVAFAMYRRMLQTLVSLSDSSGVDPLDVIELEAGFAPLEAALTQPSFLKNLLRRFSARQFTELFADGGNVALATVLRNVLTGTAGRLSTVQERAGDWDRLTSLVALALAHCWLAGPAADGKLLKGVTRLHTKVPLLPIFAEATASPVQILCRLLPPALAAQLPQGFLRQLPMHQAEYLEASCAGAAGDLAHLGLASAAWAAQMDSLLLPQQSSEAMLTRCVGLLARGLQLAAQLRRTLQVAITLHAGLAAPVSSVRLEQISHGLCLLKGIEGTYVRHADGIAEALPHLVTHCRSGLVGLLAAQRASAAALTRGAGASKPLFSLWWVEAPAVQQNVVTATELAIALAEGPVSSQQDILLGLCMDGLRATHQCCTEELSRVTAALRALRTTVQLQKLVRQECGCEWLLFHRELLPPMLRQLRRRPVQAARLPRLLAAFLDGARLLPHSASPLLPQLEGLDDELHAMLKEHLLDPIADDIDASLRLLQHHSRGPGLPHAPPSSSSTGASVDSLSQHMLPSPESLAQCQVGARPNAGPFLELKPLQLCSQTLDTRRYVSAKLEAEFHAHAAVTPGDWRRYGEICILAKDVYGLTIALPQLPPHPEEEGGLDILEVMDSMDIFAACYMHSLHGQIFVERPAAAASWQLHTLSLAHVEAALAQHGLGLMPAAVNAAYLMLGRCFVKLSQVMFGDALKSRLMAEERALEGGTRGYQPHRATALAADVCALGAAVPGQRPSQLDQIRLILTEMGNALGFVRMVRQAGLCHCTAALDFADSHPAAYSPRASARAHRGSQTQASTAFVSAEGTEGDREGRRGGSAGSGMSSEDGETGEEGDVGVFEGRAREAGLSSGALQAAVMLDATLAELQAHATEGMDFFGSLASTLGSELRAPANGHLRKLHLLTPALTLAAVEAALVAKDALKRRRRDGLDAGFVDDGFALGLAFAMQVLEQDAAFDSLQWFETVAGEQEAEIQAVLESHGVGGDGRQGRTGFVTWALEGFSRSSGPDVGSEEGLPENTKLLLTRIRSQQAEYKLLQHTLSAARMLVDSDGLH